MFDQNDQDLAVSIAEKLRAIGKHKMQRLKPEETGLN